VRGGVKGAEAVRIRVYPKEPANHAAWHEKQQSSSGMTVKPDPRIELQMPLFSAKCTRVGRAQSFLHPSKGTRASFHTSRSWRHVGDNLNHFLQLLPPLLSPCFFPPVEHTTEDAILSSGCIRIPKAHLRLIQWSSRCSNVGVFRDSSLSRRPSCRMC
jgi:hypothetical protein